MRRLFLLFCLILAPISAHAGAWLQKQGHGQLITSALYYRTDTFYDHNGDKIAGDPYSKTELNPYAEYGVTNWLTVGGNLLLADNSSSRSPFGTREDYYSMQGEIFARVPLYENANQILSLQPLIKFPTRYATHDFDTGRSGDFNLTLNKWDIIKPNNLSEIFQGNYDTELSLLAGQNFTAYGYAHFIDAGVGYRYRGGPSRNQFRLNATLGTHIDERWTTLAQAFYTRATEIPTTTAITQQTEDDYDLLKLQLSAVYALTDHVSLQAGGFVQPYARNSGTDGGVMSALWWNF